jgi:hypothetical protein
MSELKLIDVELTGEYRKPHLAEWYLHDGVAKQGPSISMSYLVRPILNDGLWAMKQMLAGQYCECGKGHFRWRNYLERFCDDLWSWNKSIYWELPEFWTRTDWRLVEPKSETPVADQARKQMKSDGWAPSSISTIADAIAALEKRLAKLEAK